MLTEKKCLSRGDIKVVSLYMLKSYRLDCFGMTSRKGSWSIAQEDIIFLDFILKKCHFLKISMFIEGMNFL